MKIGFIGLGRMGSGMSERLLEKKFSVVGYNRSPEKVKALVKKGLIPAYSLEEFLEKLGKKKIVWLMLPGGDITKDMIKKIIPFMNKGDIIVNGANDFYKNAEEESKLCKKDGIEFFDCGVSAGVHGLERGFPLTIGGSKNQFKKIEPFCKALAPKKGYGYFGPAGSGHFVKSVHNMIEYIYLQGIAEGVELMHDFKHKIDLHKAAEVWEHGSVIDSWLIELTADALEKKDFNKIESKIGSVTIDELVKTKNSLKTYTPAFDMAIKVRKDKTKRFNLGKRTIAAIRNEFGGHKVTKRKQTKK
jgi:6-phosphogluconate dehydrogenase